MMRRPVGLLSPVVVAPSVVVGFAHVDSVVLLLLLSVESLVLEAPVSAVVEHGSIHGLCAVSVLVATLEEPGLDRPLS